MMGRPQPAPGQHDKAMTIEEFLAFTDTRPQEEHWELIEGVPVMNASPTDYHQVLVGNLVMLLLRAKEQSNASWFPMIGTGTRVPASKHSLPEPDVMVKEHPPTGTPASHDALVLLEVLSPSNTKADQAWRRRVYASVPNCRHYVTVSLQAVEVTAYDRADRWKGRTLKSPEEPLALPALGIAIPVADIYRWTPLDAGRAGDEQ